jgi:hypothetical protein
MDMTLKVKRLVVIPCTPHTAALHARLSGSGNGGLHR